jgi:two-component system response regulator DesR
MEIKRKVRVFVSDDSPLIRERVGELLTSHDMEVVGEGVQPQQCIDGILATQPDVVLLDVQLEGGTGLEVLKGVRAQHPAMPFVVFSNNSADAYRRRYLAAGAASFLDKAHDFGRLPEALMLAWRAQG